MKIIKEMLKKLLKKQSYTEIMINDIQDIITNDNVLIPDVTLDEFLYGASDDINNVPLLKFKDDILNF